MIYSVLNNHPSSNTSSSYEANSKYYGAGAFNFMSECAKDELEIFENAITTDMHEVVLGESSYEMEAINEGFFENVWKKIKEIFKKFIEWIKAVTRSAVAKLANLLIVDNKKFAKFAKAKISKMKSPKSKYEYSGTYLKDTSINATEPTSAMSEATKGMHAISDLIDDLDSRSLVKFSEPNVKKAEAIQEKINNLSVSDIMEELTDNGDLNLDAVKKHLDVLEKLGREDIKKVRKNLNDHEAKCQKAIKKAERLEKDTDDKEKYEKDDSKKMWHVAPKEGETYDKKSMDHDVAKKYAANAVTICNTYKQCAQTLTTLQLSLIKSVAKVARKVVAHAAGATPKNEGFEYDDDALLFDAMNEAVLYEYDEALESMSESKGEKTDTKNVDSEEEFDEE